jgi:hypothetical protein
VRNALIEVPNIYGTHNTAGATSLLPIE